MTRKEWNKKICSYTKYFSYPEFTCKCGKCNSPAYLDPRLIIYLDLLRKYFKKPVVITSGIRCKKYNSSLVGSIPFSAHLRGAAADVYIQGIEPKDIYNWWTFNVPRGHSYYGTKNMGNACHVEIY